MNIKHCDQLASITYELSTRTTQVTGSANNSTTFVKQQSKWFFSAQPSNYNRVGIKLFW